MCKQCDAVDEIHRRHLDTRSRCFTCLLERWFLAGFDDFFRHSPTSTLKLPLQFSNVTTSHCCQQQFGRKLFNQTSHFFKLIQVFLFVFVLLMPVCSVAAYVDPVSPLPLNHTSLSQVTIFSSKLRRVFRSGALEQQPVFYTENQVPTTVQDEAKLPQEIDHAMTTRQTIVANVTAFSNTSNVTVIFIEHDNHGDEHEPPVVWVPYLGIVVIFAVFSVLIVTFWMHIRQSRYRVIQLVKSSPNSDWRELEPGFWQASYGGNVYTVSQVNQSRRLGAIAAATVQAMGEGMKSIITNDDSGSHASRESIRFCKQSSSTERLLCNTIAEEETEELQGIIKSSRNRGTRQLPPTPPGQSPNPPVRVPSGQSVPPSDSIWLLTEDQLIESIRTSNPMTSQLSSPNTPQTVLTGDESLTPSITRERDYGTFGESNSRAHEAVAKLAMVEVNENQISNPLLMQSQQSSVDTYQDPTSEIVLKTMLSSQNSNSDSTAMASSPGIANRRMTDGMYHLPNEINRSPEMSPGTYSAMFRCSIDEMTLPEPEPYTLSPQTAAAAKLASGIRQPVQRSNTSTSQSSMAGKNRAILARGSTRGRGRGAVGRGQTSSLMTYSNMGKKKSGFIIPRT